MKKGTLWAALLAAMVWTGAAWAAETPAAAPDQPVPAASSGRRANRRGPRGGRMLEQLKEKFPQETAEIEALREKDPRAAMEKTRELMKKAGIEMPRRRGRGQQGDRGEALQKAMAELRAKDAAACAKIEELQKSDPVKALEELKKLAEKHQVKLPEGLTLVNRASSRNENRNYVVRARFLLQKTHPDALAKVDELQKSDPDAARTAFRELVASAGITLEQLRNFNGEDAPSRAVEILDPADEELLNQNGSTRRNNTGTGFGFGGPPPGFGGFGGPPPGFGDR